jgi:hypothetical protein
MTTTTTVTNHRPVVGAPGAEAFLAEAAELARGQAYARIARLLAERVASLDLSEARRVAIESGRGVVIARHADGCGLVLRWFRAGEPTAIHDHGTWGALTVVEGEQRYDRYERIGEAEAELQATHYLRAGDTLWWPTPPGDLHVQEGLSAGALELLFLGGDPDIAPTRHYGARHTVHSDVLSAVHAAYVSGDAAPIATWYDEDVIADINVPAWRFQVQGRDNVVELLTSQELSLPGRRLTMFRPVHGTPSVVAAETEVHVADDGQGEGRYRNLHVLRLRGGRIIEQLTYCTGHWDAEMIHRQEHEAPMVRP